MTMLLPKPAAALSGSLRRAGWEVTHRTGEGRMTTSTLGSPRADGTRPRVTQGVPVVSVSVRGVLDGRSVAAVWVRPTDAVRGPWRLHLTVARAGGVVVSVGSTPSLTALRVWAGLPK
jgi:hypothetical protein